MRRKKSLFKHMTFPEITLVPLIDTFSTLLVIFIMAAPMVQNSIKVDLPQGKSKEIGGNQELVVTLNKHGKIFFNSFPTTIKNLPNAVKNELKYKEDTPVFVRADETVSYGKVIEVVDELKQAGVKYVAMSTRPSA
jgi:biopolymer transport protein ExbD